MTPLPTLSWPPILLRAARPSDAADRQLSGRSAELTRMCGGSSGGPSQMTEKEAIAWSQRAAAEPYGWVIDLDDRAIGTVRL
ncbi:MAG: hypothetical protein GX657_13695, partial [Chloroflexi bacterium]|nr:hypothetical protein [Chloroflexota bacterium]